MAILQSSGTDAVEDTDAQVLARVIGEPAQRFPTQPPHRGPESPSAQACELTILMPCLNEARTIAVCVTKARRFLQSAGIDGEVLVADNGSTDASRSVAESAGAIVIEVPRKGYGAALIAGIHAARGRFIIMGDADDSYDFLSLQPFLTGMRAGNDLVIGNRFTGGIADGAMPKLHRYLGNPVLSLLGRVFFRAPVGDFHCGLRGFDRSRILALDLTAPGMEFASELIVKASLAGYRIAEVPTTLVKDGRDRPPHLRSWRDGWRHLKFLLAFSPRWLFMYPGSALLIAGWLVQLLLLPGALQVGSIGFDIHTMLFGAGASLLGVQLCVMALLARCAGIQIGLLPAHGAALWVLRHLRVETVVAIAAPIALAAMICALRAASLWEQSHFASLDPTVVMRPAILALSLGVSAVELIIGAFFLTLLQFASRRGAADTDAPRGERQR